jgi:hypothetical protein
LIAIWEKGWNVLFETIDVLGTMATSMNMPISPNAKDDYCRNYYPTN